MKHSTNIKNTLKICDNKYIFCRDSYTSEGGYESCNSYSYLNRFPTEKDTYYNDRKKNTWLENIYKPMINLFWTPIASQSINIAVQTSNDDLRNISKHLQIVKKSNKALLDLIQYDISVFSVAIDIFDNGEMDYASYPDIEQIFPQDIKLLQMKGIDVYSAKYIEYKFYDNLYIPIHVEYEDNLFVKTTKAWYSDNNKLTLTDMGESRRCKMFDSFQYGVLSKVGEELGSTPYSYDLAISQLKMYNQDSDRRNILRKNGYPVLMISTDKEIEAIETGASNGIKVGSEDKFPELLEADLTGVQISSEILENDKEFIYKTWSNGLLSSNVVYNSATASAIASKGFQNTVNVFYNSYQYILETMIDSIIFIYDKPITYNMDYPTLDINETSMKDEIDKIL